MFLRVDIIWSWKRSANGFPGGRHRRRAPEAIRRPLLIRKRGVGESIYCIFYDYSIHASRRRIFASLWVFLIRGPFTVIRFDASETQVLMWDGFLSLLFFIQHSGMVRASFRNRISSSIPSDYHPATYSILSGIVLTVVVLLWQTSQTVLFQIQGPLRVLPRVISSSQSLVSFGESARSERSTPLAGPRCGPSPRRATPAAKLRPRGALSLGSPSSLFFQPCSHMVGSRRKFRPRAL